MHHSASNKAAAAPPNRESALASLLGVTEARAKHLAQRLDKTISIDYLKKNFDALANGFSLSNLEMQKVARHSPEILESLAATILQNANEIKDLFGFEQKQVRQLFIEAPTIFGMLPQSLYTRALAKCELLGIDLATYRLMCLRRPVFLYQPASTTAEKLNQLSEKLNIPLSEAIDLALRAPELLTRKIETIQNQLMATAKGLKISFGQAVDLIERSSSVATQRSETLINNTKTLAQLLEISMNAVIALCLKEPRLMARDPISIATNLKLIELNRSGSKMSLSEYISGSPHMLLMSPERNLAHFFLRELTNTRPMLNLNPYRALARSKVTFSNETLLERFDQACMKIEAAGIFELDVLQPNTIRQFRGMLEQAINCKKVDAGDLSELLQAAMAQNQQERRASKLLKMQSLEGLEPNPALN